MPRVKNGVAHHARKKKIMQAAKGARGGRSVGRGGGVQDAAGAGEAGLM